MKTELEIARAHDFLVGIVLDEVPHPPMDKEVIQSIKCYAETLCWILDHSHNPTFVDNLKKLEQWFESQRYELEHRAN